MPIETLAVVLGAFLLAALVKGTTGLGFSTTAVAPLALALGLPAALPLMIVPSLTSNVIVMVGAGHFRETVRRFWPLYLSALPGIACGLALLTWLDGAVAGACLGVVLAVYGVWMLARRSVGPPLAPRAARRLAPLVGLTTGTVNGLTGSQVMPVLPYLLALRLDPDRFVQAINISFSLSSLAMALGLWRIGLLTGDTLAVSVAGLAPVFLGTWLGAKLRRRLAPELFRRIVLTLLIVLGCVLIAKALT
ncbi:MAG: sulfite exporter TauE/SafE family protein [Rhodospirillaceae bacterium]|nr:sulfite exporter TauE/SafE family protein [Rhodospirillaceae bacterium]